MTKFEEKALKEAEKCGYVMAKSKIAFYEDEKGITFVDFNRTHTNFNFPWLEFAKNWHSDEEFQAKEKEIERLRKINHLYKKAKGNAERLAVDRGERLNQAQDELASIESQLQQQTLPVVPSFVAEWIEHCKGMGYGLTASLTSKLSSTMHEELSNKILKWLGNEENDETFALAFITGNYEVEEKKFYLRNKLTGMYLYKKPLGGYGEDPDNYIKDLTSDFKFTQKEIDGMDVQSYEKIEVE